MVMIAMFVVMGMCVMRIMGVLMAMLVGVLMAVLVMMSRAVRGIAARFRLCRRFTRGGFCGSKRLERFLEFYVGSLHKTNASSNHFRCLVHPQLFEDKRNLFISLHMVNVMVFPVRQTNSALFRFIHGGPHYLIQASLIGTHACVSVAAVRYTP